MDEVLPVLSGIVIGLITHRLSPVGLRAVLFAVLAVVAGVGASSVSGELAISWLYVLIDLAQVLVAGMLTSIVVERWLLRLWSRGRRDRLAG